MIRVYDDAGNVIETHEHKRVVTILDLADSRLLFLAELLERGIGAQRIPERI